MTPEQTAAFLNSQVACAMIEAMGMQAENQQRAVLGYSMAYTAEDFAAIADRYGIDCNAALTTLRDAT